MAPSNKNPRVVVSFFGSIGQPQACNELLTEFVFLAPALAGGGVGGVLSRTYLRFWPPGGVRGGGTQKTSKKQYTIITAVSGVLCLGSGVLRVRDARGRVRNHAICVGAVTGRRLYRSCLKNFCPNSNKVYLLLQHPSMVLFSPRYEVSCNCAPGRGLFCDI